MTDLNINPFNSLYPTGRPLLSYAKPNYSQTLDFKEASYPSRDPKGLQPSYVTETRTILHQASSTLPDQRAITINSERRLYDNNIKLRYPDLMFKKSSKVIAPPTTFVAKTNTELLTELNTYPDGVRKVNNVNPAEERGRIIKEYQKLMQEAEQIDPSKLPENQREFMMEEKQRKIQYAKNYLLKHAPDVYSILQQRQHMGKHVEHHEKVEGHHVNVEGHHAKVEDHHEDVKENHGEVKGVLSELVEAMKGRKFDVGKVEKEQEERREAIKKDVEKGSEFKQELLAKKKPSPPDLETPPKEPEDEVAKDDSELKVADLQKRYSAFPVSEWIDVATDDTVLRLFGSKARTLRNLRELFFEIHPEAPKREFQLFMEHVVRKRLVEDRPRVDKEALEQFIQVIKNKSYMNDESKE